MLPKGLVKTGSGALSLSKARAGPENLHFEQVFSGACVAALETAHRGLLTDLGKISVLYSAIL